MRFTLRLPWLTTAQNTMVVHLLSAFLLAFISQMTASATPYANIGALWAAVTSAAFAALLTVVKSIATIGALQKTGGERATFKEKNAAYQIGIGIAVMFIGTLAASLLTGVAHASTFPDLVAVISAAISAAAFAVVQYVFNLVPGPKPSPTPVVTTPSTT